MSIRFQHGDSMYDVTPVENLFIETFLPQVPGDFVKVYLYGLMLCYRGEDRPLGVPELAAALELSAEQVRAAFALWEEKGVLRMLSSEPLEVEYVNLKHSFINGSRAQEPHGNAEYKQLCAQLEQMFRSQRVLGHGELLLVREWLDTLHMESAAIVLLVSYYVGEKSPRVSFAYLDKMLRARADAGDTSFEAASAYIKRREAMQSGAATLLKRWNISRMPSDDEMALYHKWKNDWGFDDNAVLAAAGEAVSSSYPNFKYLDRILDSLRQENLCSGPEVARHLQERAQEEDACLTLLRALGLRGSSPSSQSVRELYRRRIEQNFTPEALCAAASLLQRKGRSSLAHLDALLDSYLEQGLTTRGAIEAHQAHEEEAARAVQEWLQIWGMERAPYENELKAYHIFTEQWSLPPELLAMAARESVSASYPLSYMSRILQTCREKGITTPQQYQAQKTAPGNQSLKDFAERDYANQHQYEAQDFDALYTDIFDSKGKL